MRQQYNTDGTVHKEPCNAADGELPVLPLWNPLRPRSHLMASLPEKLDIFQVSALSLGRKVNVCEYL